MYINLGCDFNSLYEFYYYTTHHCDYCKHNINLSKFAKYLCHRWYTYMHVQYVNICITGPLLKVFCSYVALCQWGDNFSWENLQCKSDLKTLFSVNPGLVKIPNRVTEVWVGSCWSISSFLWDYKISAVKFGCTGIWNSQN